MLLQVPVGTINLNGIQYKISAFWRDDDRQAYASRAAKTYKTRYLVCRLHVGYSSFFSPYGLYNPTSGLTSRVRVWLITESAVPAVSAGVSVQSVKGMALLFNTI